MKTEGHAKTDFKLSEFAPPTEWGHTGYITVDTQEPFLLNDDMELVIFFTPHEGTTFEEIEALSYELDKKLAKVHFNIQHRQPRY